MKKKILALAVAVAMLAGSVPANATPVTIYNGKTDQTTVYVLQSATTASLRQMFSRSYYEYKKEHPGTKMKVDDYKLSFNNYDNDKRRLMVLAGFIFADHPSVDDVAIEAIETTGKKRRILFYVTRTLVEGAYDMEFPQNKDAGWYTAFKTKVFGDEMTPYFVDGGTVVIK